MGFERCFLVNPQRSCELWAQLWKWNKASLVSYIVILTTSRKTNDLITHSFAGFYPKQAFEKKGSPCHILKRIQRSCPSHWGLLIPLGWKGHQGNWRICGSYKAGKLTFCISAKITNKKRYGDFERPCILKQLKEVSSIERSLHSSSDLLGAAGIVGMCVQNPAPSHPGPCCCPTSMAIFMSLVPSVFKDAPQEAANKKTMFKCLPCY